MALFKGFASLLERPVRFLSLSGWSLKPFREAFTHEEGCVFPQNVKTAARQFKQTGHPIFLSHVRQTLIRLRYPRFIVSQAVRELIRQRRRSCQRRRSSW
jgi:hypothetical protein